MPRITIFLHSVEKLALFKLAEIERRDPRHQAALIIRQELERLGLVAQDTTTQEPRNNEN